MEAWSSVGRLAVALSVGSFVVPAAALLLAWRFRAANALQQDQIWRSASVVLLIMAAVAPFQPIRLALPVPRLVAEAGYSIGIPVTERVKLSADRPGERAVEKLTIRWSQPNTAAQALLGVWLFGVIMMAVRTAMIYGRAARLVRSAPIAPRHVTASLEQRLPSALLATKFGLHLSDDGPAFAWGHVRPRIVLPNAVIKTPSVAALILNHEIQHVRRRDFALQLFADVLRCLVWWNPLIWMLGRRLRVQRELAADAAVLETGPDPRAYCEALLAAVSDFSPAPAAADRSTLVTRARAIIEWRAASRQPRWTTWSTWTVTLACAAAILLFGMVHAPMGTIRNGAESASAAIVRMP